MAIARVQDITGNGGGYVLDMDLVFGTNNTAGNLIVIATNSIYDIDTITDTQGNTYTKIQDDLWNINGELWYAKNISGGANTITVSVDQTGGPNYDDIIATAVEFSGLDTTAPLDVSAENRASAYVTSHPTGTTATTTQANELCFAMYIGDNNDLTYTVGGSYINLVDTNGNDLYSSLVVADKIVSATGTQSATFTSTSSMFGYGAIATFKEAVVDTITSPIKTGINIGDVWKDVEAIKINIGDVWKVTTGAWINIGDVWKEIYATAPASNGLLTNLVSYYKFEGDATDSHGTNDLTVYGATAVTGKNGNGYSYDGTNDYVGGANKFNQDGNTAFAIGVWTKYTGTKYKEFISKQDISAGYKGYFMLTTGTNITVGSGQSGNLNSRYISDTLNDGSWHLLIGAYDGLKTSTSWKIYIDGSEVSTTYSGSGTTSNFSNVASLNFGSRDDGASLHHNGTMDEGFLYEGGFTATQASDIWNSGTGTFYADFT